MTDVQGLPDITITLGRDRLTPAEAASVASIEVTAALAQPAMCSITWLTLDAGSRVNPEPGDALRVEIAGIRRALFVGEVTVVEHSYGADLSEEIRVRAYDALHRLRKRQFTRLHDNVDLNGLAAALCAGTGLHVVGGNGRPGPVYQLARSDLSLLVEASRRRGLYPVVDDDALRLVDLTGEGDPVELLLGSTLHSAEVELSQEPAFLSAVVTGWNPTQAAGVHGDSGDNRARAGVGADAAPQSVGGGGALLRQNDVLVDDATAADLAQAELDVRAGGEVTGVFVAEGNPRIRVGGRVSISGVAPHLEGIFTVCRVVHLIAGSGYETTISTTPPPVPLAAPGARAADVTTLGLVIEVEDPQQRGRVRVDLAAFPHVSTGWAPVLTMGAGTGKGAVLLPNVDDTVLVLLTAGDPNDAIVLGGLFGPERVPDADNGGERGRRFTVATADGQRVILDGAAHTIRLEDGHGSSLSLTPELFSIHSATDLTIEAPGRAMRVRAQTVDFEEAT
ncbi:phage baseplate assembly protein V [Cryobacterium psychrophilum]|uniref:Type IV secretion protein Rhs n=1 Tax=Cryobacterium psychrophilum TaxID=41988 RepID=A0A4Y8KIX2_9MICO|nr:phage baseplate assembly protein V [Cryobacterium psychrophilum]TDW30879.1 phage baseplate assembly protein gpV [Cryobacterium psychrophilum]TFD75733.1 type IV secretion protein Rhs [Cryobacterium psychrophilum]